MQENTSQTLTSGNTNPLIVDMDLMDSQTIVQTMNEEDLLVAPAVKKAITEIALGVDLIVKQFNQGGRLIYVGDGTSVLLAVLDALECPPTFGTSQDQVLFILAGGDKAFLESVEGAEDDAQSGGNDLKDVFLHERDCVVAVSASGRTPYCIGALKYAQSIGAACISVSCNRKVEMGKYADISIEVLVGSEVLSGSTRLKAGTAQKLVLNMLSTASMIRTGRVYRNMMVDMQPTNTKLQQRAIQIVRDITDATEEVANDTLIRVDWKIKTAIVCLMTGVTPAEAIILLEKAGGFVRKALSQSIK